MAGLTVTEKEHWKDRIGRRIDKRIEAIQAEDPNLMLGDPSTPLQRAALDIPPLQAGDE